MGLTKKGKEFFKLTSSLTESIRNIVVEDTKIWTGCEFVYNLYDNGQDTAFYMSRDQINALAIGKPPQWSIFASENQKHIHCISPSFRSHS